MWKLLVFVVMFLGVVSCKEKNCVSSPLVLFDDLSEPGVDYYLYDYDTLRIEIPSVVTPNNDGFNDVFITKTNITKSNFVAVDFKIRNNCRETIYKQHGTFPFVIPDLDNMVDGAYNFDFSIVLNDKRVISGGGVINIIRK